MTQSFSSDQTTDPTISFFERRDYILMNLNFANAMLKARARGEEHFTIGPLVDHTVLFPKHFERPPLYSCIGSAAALCAEETNQHDGVSHKPAGIGGGR